MRGWQELVEGQGLGGDGDPVESGVEADRPLPPGHQLRLLHTPAVS